MLRDNEFSYNIMTFLAASWNDEETTSFCLFSIFCFFSNTEPFVFKRFLQSHKNNGSRWRNLRKKNRISVSKKTRKRK